MASSLPVAGAGRSRPRLRCRRAGRRCGCVGGCAERRGRSAASPARPTRGPDRTGPHARSSGCSHTGACRASHDAVSATVRAVTPVREVFDLLGGEPGGGAQLAVQHDGGALGDVHSAKKWGCWSRSRPARRSRALAPCVATSGAGRPVDERTAVPAAPARACARCCQVGLLVLGALLVDHVGDVSTSMRGRLVGATARRLRVGTRHGLLASAWPKSPCSAAAAKAELAQLVSATLRRWRGAREDHDSPGPGPQHAGEHLDLVHRMGAGNTLLLDSSTVARTWVLGPDAGWAGAHVAGPA